MRAVLTELFALSLSNTCIYRSGFAYGRRCTTTKFRTSPRTLKKNSIGSTRPLGTLLVATAATRRGVDKHWNAGTCICSVQRRTTRFLSSHAPLSLCRPHSFCLLCFSLSSISLSSRHVIVGRNFGSYVTHETKHFIYFYLGQVAILLFKAG